MTNDHEFKTNGFAVFLAFFTAYCTLASTQVDTISLDRFTPILPKSHFDMRITSESLVQAISLTESPDDAVYANACALLESIGFEGPMYSAGPFERLFRIYREEILPRIRATQDQFSIWVGSASIELRAQIELVVLSTQQKTVSVRLEVLDYLAAMQHEGLAGPKTARIVIFCATADAMMKLVATDGTFEIGSLTNSDWLMIALAFIRLNMDAHSSDRFQQ